ncbi:thioesterase family protein [Marivita sp. S2033]|uniref:thioesterase family protein n=1 Tax=Marivita sp. S2033 TaxID=3373187 RepID=UPI003981F01C
MTRKAAIIGANAAGQEWAARFVVMGWDVRIFDPVATPDHNMDDTIANAARVLPMLYEAPMPTRGTVRVAESLAEAVQEAEWIYLSGAGPLVESLKTVQEVQIHCADDAVIVVSDPEALLACQRHAERPEQIVSARAVSPVYLLPLVELVSNATTSHVMIESATAILSAVGMAPAQGIDIRDRDRPGLNWGQAALFDADAAAGEGAGRRDDALVAVLRALKQQEVGAGRLILEHDNTLRGPLGDAVPLVTVRRVVPVDWTDMNGHMNEGRYGQLFSDASEELMTHIGADRAYIAAGNSYFTAETNIRYLNETHAGEDIRVTTRVTLGQGKKLRLWHEMVRSADGACLATCDQFLLHVSLKTRRSCPPLPHVKAMVERLADRHRVIPVETEGESLA